MRTKLKLSVLSLLFAIQVSGAAAVDVKTVGDIGALEGDPSNAETVIVKNYSTVGDGGGGVFVTDHTSGCKISPDAGVVVQNGNSQCYYRQFNGPVHLAWYGVKDAAADTGATSCWKTLLQMDGCDATDAVNRAFAAAAQSAGLGGDGGVVTDGRSIVISSDNLHIPANGYFSCAAPPGGQRNQNGTSNDVPYYLQPNSIVLEPGTWSSPSNLTVWRDANSLLKSCIIRPTWYNADTLQTKVLGSSTPTRALIDDIEHAFVGTATTCGTNPNNGSTVDGEACNMQDVLIIGFDVCDDTRASANAVFSNLKYECNVGEFIHNNGGGMKVENANVHNFIEGVLETGAPGSGVDITKAQWPIHAIASDTNGEVKITIDTSGATRDQIANGDTVIIGNFPLYSGPPAFNGRWIVECSNAPPTPCGGTFDLKNSSYTGPSSTASWQTGATAVSVPDTAYIGAGQYLCTSTNPFPPFCSTPTGFGGSPGILQTTIVNGTDKPTVQVSTTAGWPQSGLVCIPATVCTGATSEFLAYKLVDATHIQITTRGVEGTRAQSHGSGLSIRPAAPMVIATVPSLNKVIVNAAASVSGAGAAVEFLNDTYLAGFTSDCSATTSTCALLNANYRTWTGKEEAGATPDGRLTSIVAGVTGDTLTVPGNIFKLQPGMQVLDLSLNPVACLQDSMNNCLLVKSISVSAGTVQLSGTPANLTANDSVLFTGCGYPGYPGIGLSGSPQPWLGNCAATAYLFYGIDSALGGAGTACDYIHAHGWRVYMHMNNGQETVCSKMVFDSGSGGTASGGIDNNATADPTSIGIWVEGDGDKIELADCKAEARTAFLNTGTQENNGVGLSNFNLSTNSDFSLVFANSGRSNLSQLHGSASGAGYADSSELGLTLTADDLGSVTVYYDDPSQLASLRCANNSFASPFCSNAVHIGAGGAVPVIASGAGSTATFNGNDGAGRITTGGSNIASSVVLNFATAWKAPPVCLAQDDDFQINPVIGTTTTSTVTFKTNSSAFGSGDNISYQCVGFK